MKPCKTCGQMAYLRTGGGRECSQCLRKTRLKKGPLNVCVDCGGECSGYSSRCVECHRKSTPKRQIETVHPVFCECGKEKSPTAQRCQACYGALLEWKKEYDVGHGITMTSFEIARLSGVCRATIVARLKRGVRGVKLFVPRLSR